MPRAASARRGDAPPRACDALYYALGGGLGHGLRALALARQLARRVGGRHVLLVNTPFAATLAAAVDADRSPSGRAIELRRLAPDATPAEAGLAMLALRDELRPALLAVDTFPRGLGGELAEWLPRWTDGLKVLVSRTLPASYVDEFDLAAHAARTYDLVVAPGEPSPLGGVAHGPRIATTAPWLVRSPDELLAAPDAARRLGVPDGRACLLVVGTGTAVECDEWGRWFAELACDWPASAPRPRLALPREAFAPAGVAAEHVVRHSPLVELFRGAALVVGSAGYHLVHETRAAGAPGLFLVRRRRYDDQASRLTDAERAIDLADLRRRLLVRFASGAEACGADPAACESPRVAAPNGAEQAAELIARWLADATGR